MIPLYRQHTSGFAYIELLIALGLLTAIVSLTSFMNTDALLRLRVREERDMFATVLLLGTRTRALSNVHQTAHGIHIDHEKHAYVLFEGDMYRPNAAQNRVVHWKSDRVSITAKDGSDTVIFEALTGNVSEGADTFTITDGSASLSVSVNRSGQINW